MKLISKLFLAFILATLPVFAFSAGMLPIVISVGSMTKKTQTPAPTLTQAGSGALYEMYRANERIKEPLEMIPVASFCNIAVTGPNSSTRSPKMVSLIGRFRETVADHLYYEIVQAGWYSDPATPSCVGAWFVIIPKSKVLDIEKLPAK